MRTASLLLAVCAFAPWAGAADRGSQLLVSLSMTKAQINSPTPPTSGLFAETPEGGWIHLGGEQIKWVNCCCPSGPDLMLLGCGNGILRSTDGGASWRLTTGWEVADVLCIRSDPAARGVYYAATGWGVWKSPDFGARWSESDEGLPAPARFVQTLAANDRDPRTVLIGTAGGLYVSIDEAVHWAPVTGGPKAPILCLNQSVRSPANWIAGTDGAGVFLSGDEGRSWRSAAEPLRGDKVYGACADPFDGASFAAGSWEHGVWVTHNGGAGWRDIAAGLPGPHVTALAYDPRCKGRIWAAVFEAGLYRTDDGGRHWTYSGLEGADILELRFGR